MPLPPMGVDTTPSLLHHARRASTNKVVPEIYDGEVPPPLPSLADHLNDGFGRGGGAARSAADGGQESLLAVHTAQRRPLQPRQCSVVGGAAVPLQCPQQSVPSSACFTAFSAAKARLAPMRQHSLAATLSEHGAKAAVREFGPSS